MKFKSKIGVLIVVTILILLLLPLLIAATPASTNFTRLQFDNTHINDDLTYFENAGNFNADDFRGNVNPSLALFLEYAFHPTLQSSFALYIYIHNPGGRQFHHHGNTVQMAYRYSETGMPAGYRKFGLYYLNSTFGAFGNREFSKFRVLGAEMHLARFGDGNAERRYDISGFELHFVGDMNPTEFGVAKTYIFTGYLATLQGRQKPLDTIELFVNHTWWRGAYNDLGVGWQSQINSVYFSVPANVMSQFGDRLHRVRASWYEFRTAPVVVTDYTRLYSAIRPFVGQVMATHNPNIDFVLYGAPRRPGIELPQHAISQADWAWNFTRRPHWTEPWSEQIPQLNVLAYLFYTRGVAMRDFVLHGDVLLNWINGYAAQFPQSVARGLVTNAPANRRLPQELFAADIGRGRVQGYNNFNFQADQGFSLLGHPGFRWWENWFRRPQVADSQFDILPIVEVTAAQVANRYTDAQIARTFFINQADVAGFREYVRTATAAGRRVHKLRFAATDYRTAPVFTHATFFTWNTAAFFAQQNIFLNFDIIELTFDSDGVYVTVPVVMSPIDIVSNITPPPSWVPDVAGLPWWAWLVLGLLAIILFFVVVKLGIGLVVSGLGMVLMLPFRVLKMLLANPRKRGDG